MSVQCSKGSDLEQQNLIACLSVCLPQALTIHFAKNLTCESNNNFIYAKRDRALFVKAYTCN